MQVRVLLFVRGGNTNVVEKLRDFIASNPGYTKRTNSELSLREVYVELEMIIPTSLLVILSSPTLSNT